MNPFARFLPPHRPVCLCIGENPPPLGDTNLFVRDMNALAPLLEQVGARYDLIVVDAGASDASVENLLAGLFLKNPVHTAVGSVKELLSAHGNVVVCANHACFSPTLLNQCWLHLNRGISHAYYFSRDHTGGPCPTEDPQAWLTHRKGALVDRTNACPDTLERHTAAVQELEARNNWGSPVGMFDISPKYYTDGIRLGLSPRAFPLLSRSVPLLQKHWMKLFDERPLRAIMRIPSDRTMLRSIVTSNHWRIHPEAMQLIQSAFSEHAQIHAPFTAQTEPQRLAWLDEVATVERRVLNIPVTELFIPELLSAFPEAKEYPMRVAYCDTEGDTQRPASDGTAEDVTIQGRTMIAVVIDEQGTEHRFGYQCDHTWVQFLALFHPPLVADIAALHPEKYQDARHWLIQFAHKLTTKNEPAPAA